MLPSEMGTTPLHLAIILVRANVYLDASVTLALGGTILDTFI